MKLSIKHFVFLLGLFFLPLHANASGDNLRSALEKIWSGHIAAYESGNISAIKDTMSSFAFGSMMNNLRDAGQELTPELFQQFAKNAPDISQMKFIKIIENGPTAGLLYSKDTEFYKGSKIYRTFAFIKFVKENAVWKVHFVFTYGCDKMRADGKECTFPFADLPPEAAIDGRVPEAPPESSGPYARGYVDVSTGGFKTSVVINGVQQYSGVKGISRLITGGLRKGTNTVMIVFAKNDKKSPLEPSVTIRRIMGAASPKEVFRYAPKNNIAGKHILKFVLD
jgi:hypothetical protein